MAKNDVCLSACVGAPPTGFIFLKFNIADVCEKSVEQLQIWLQSDFTSCKDVSIFALVIGVQNILWLDIDAKGTHYCVFIAKLYGFTVDS